MIGVVGEDRLQQMVVDGGRERRVETDRWGRVGIVVDRLGVGGGGDRSVETRTSRRRDRSVEDESQVE